MSDDDKPARPVEKLDTDDPLNRALGAIQLTINEMANTCWTFVEDAMRKARTLGVQGVLDVKMTIVHDKLIVRRAMRKFGTNAPVGKWWSLPLTRQVIDEYFERIKPEPAPAETTALDVDASAAQPEPAKFSPVEMLRARVRELGAFAGNLARSRDEIAAAGAAGEVIEQMAEAAGNLELARRALVAASAIQTLKDTLQ